MLVPLVSQQQIERQRTRHCTQEQLVELKRENLQSQAKDWLRDVAYSPLGETYFCSGDKARTLIHRKTNLNISSCSEWRKRIKIHCLKEGDFVRFVIKEQTPQAKAHGKQKTQCLQRRRRIILQYLFTLTWSPQMSRTSDPRLIYQLNLLLALTSNLLQWSQTTLKISDVSFQVARPALQPSKA
jgi:hypothetical protein